MRPLLPRWLISPSCGQQHLDWTVECLLGLGLARIFLLDRRHQLNTIQFFRFDLFRKPGGQNFLGDRRGSARIQAA